eukprot:4968424-Amphidinium_carterae.1
MQVGAVAALAKRRRLTQDLEVSIMEGASLPDTVLQVLQAIQILVYTWAMTGTAEREREQTSPRSES